MSIMRSAVADATRVEWNRPDVDEDREATMIERARSRFAAHRQAGGEVLERQPNGTYKRVTEFNPEADELVLLPPVAGG